jgi:hypothetical protein
MTTLARILRRLIAPTNEHSSSSRASNAALEAGELRVCRLEDRRVLAADLVGGMSGAGDASDAGLGDDLSTMALPVITVPGNQSSAEGASLVFSPATGREIRVDAPGLGSNPLRLDINAFESLGQVTPFISFGTTAGLTVTGNGVNIFQLHGSLANINAALASLAFYAPDDGVFTLNLLATDPSTGENDSASLDIAVANLPPQLRVSSSDNAQEGSHIDVPMQMLDPGAFDNPQLSWTVSRGSQVVASGAGAPVQFFAPDDGVYQLTISALDKDGGATVVRENIFVRNVDPDFSLTGVMQNRVANLTISIDDPGQELFVVQIDWTSNGMFETHFSQDKVLSLSHQYTPEELAQAGELTISVQVADNMSIARQTLQFREAEPVAAERPEFPAPPQETPPDRTVTTRVQTSGATAQLVSADLGRVATHGGQAVPALHQFVLRVVGPDGQESESYPLPGDALADLPSFLNGLGVPDGHYRVYLITGELERLVIDGHLRAGRIVDPTDETQSGFDSPQGAVAAHGAAAAHDGMVRDSAALASKSIVGRGITAASEPAIETSAEDSAKADAQDQVIDPLAADAAEVTSSTSERQTDEDQSNLATPAIAGAIVVCAASTILHTTVSRQIAIEPAPRFCKRARLARKLARR